MKPPLPSPRALVQLLSPKLVVLACARNVTCSYRYFYNDALPRTRFERARVQEPSNVLIENEWKTLLAHKATFPCSHQFACFLNLIMVILRRQ